MLRLIDSHCHLDFAAFDKNREQELQHCAEQGVEAVVIPGVAAASWGALSDLCALHANLFPAYGLHPYFLDQHLDQHIDVLAQHLRANQAVAVGEFGLDYFLAELDPERQQTLFTAQLDIAKQLALPVILHVRKAHDQVLKELRRLQLPQAGVVHAFSGSEQQARQYIELGFKLGFGGAVTYERARKLRRLAVNLPLAAIVLETDAPDMAPAFAPQGEPNRPSFLPGIARCMAELRGIGVDELAEQTRANAVSLFRLPLKSE